MKKNLLVLVFGLMICQTKIFAQCNQTTASDTLDINNINALIMNGGDMWWNRSKGTAHYYVPKSGNVSTLFAGAIWMGGYDQADNLHMAAQTYRQNGNDYFSGPLDTSGNVNSNTCSEYDKIWKIYAADIAAHIANATHTTINTPSSILEWPAKGNPYAKGAFGSSLTITQTLAPFIDVNNDGIYNPLDGDYPDICGDEALWYVINDKGNAHTESNCTALGLEIQCMAYAFASNDADISNTTFYKYYITNKSHYVYDSFHFGIWVDPDLGCYTNDYFGSDSARQMLIVYNSTANDIPCPTGYGTTIPIQGITLLNAKNNSTNANYKMHGIYYYLNSTPSSMADPSSCYGYYGALTGSWKDSTHLTFGGSGHGGTIKTDYAFPDNPSLSGTNPNTGLPYWSMCNPTLSPGDMRSLISIGPMKIVPNDIVELNFAAITHWGDVYPCPSFAGIGASHDSVLSFFNTLKCGRYSSHSLGVNNVATAASFSVFPNPTNSKVYINNPSHENFTIQIFDVTGKQLQQKNCSQSIDEIDLANYSSGIYFYSIENKLSGIAQRGKLVKQ